VKRVAATVALLAGAAAAACGGGQYIYGPLGAVLAQPKGKGCAFTLIEKIPEQAYDPLGVLAPVDIATRKVPSGDAAFGKAVARQVCDAGGDAVVAERDAQGRYVRGTVIKLR
jgi:hypothetical protein